MKSYPSFTREFVLDELSMVEGWMWHSFAYLDDPAHKFGGVDAKHGYVFEESQKLIQQAKDCWSKQK